MFEANLKRAREAGELLDRYVTHYGGDEECAVVDTLGNLMHYCEMKGIDFDEECDQARVHYLAEQAIEEPS